MSDNGYREENAIRELQTVEWVRKPRVNPEEIQKTKVEKCNLDVFTRSLAFVLKMFRDNSTNVF